MWIASPRRSRGLAIHTGTLNRPELGQAEADRCALSDLARDADGAVVGYESVYLCDASVFPAIPDANTHLPTTMLAERLTARWRTGRS